MGITFRYTEEGVPVSLCRAARLYYISTAGGFFVPEEYGFGYIKALAQDFYGIEKVKLITANGLDIDGTDVDGIMKAAEKSISLGEDDA